MHRVGAAAHCSVPPPALLKSSLLLGGGSDPPSSRRHWTQLSRLFAAAAPSHLGSCFSGTLEAVGCVHRAFEPNTPSSCRVLAFYCM